LNSIENHRGPKITLAPAGRSASVFKDIKDLLKNNTIISDDVIDTLISEYVWNY